MRKVNFLKLFDLRFKSDFLSFILVNETWSAECRTTSLHYVSLTRKDYISAERGVRSTERLHSANAPLTRKKLIDYICIYPTFLDFAVWMQYATKVKQQRVAVLMYCALKGFCL